MGEKIVYVVDDDKDMRASMQALLKSAGLKARIFESAKDVLADPTLVQAGCLVADIRMPDMDGLMLQEELVRRGISPPIIFVTGHGDVPLAVRALKAGASDFIEKPFDGEILIAAVKHLLSSAPKEPNRVAASRAAAERIGALTAREREVLECLVIGEANKVIAYKLAISPRTVEIHRAHVMEKTRCGSLSELVRLAIAAGINPAS